MFTCCGRGYGSWLPIPKFRRTFPNTPIFGFFGRGEIGITHLPKFPSPDSGEEEKVTPKKRRKAFHQYSTIIVLLSFL
ncbi:F-box only protein 22 [Portunus trituberculatus]|uniref:F-box only protein 22 n=1 Tax=Portunus trituberculatus TaxID=210409 RepID=A0A5B7J0A1_PORTR|nr:F-box only protein 22 [Portunus trituberculatus]